MASEKLDWAKMQLRNIKSIDYENISYCEYPQVMAELLSTMATCVLDVISYVEQEIVKKSGVLEMGGLSVIGPGEDENIATGRK